MSAIVYLDTETTGWPWEGAEILELAILADSGEVLFNERFLPNAESWPEAEKVHGITPNDVSQCNPFGQYQKSICELLKGKTVVAYNAEFDQAALDAEFRLQRAISHPIEAEWECAMKRFAPYYGDWSEWHQSYKWTSLSNAARHCGHIWHGKAHSALSDCKATRTVWHWMNRAQNHMENGGLKYNVTPPEEWTDAKTP
jgi:DNA polymerase-3 subunit epsilon